MDHNLNTPCRLMGIVNVTPDSFSDGGEFIDPAAAIAHGARLARQGADILDIGGESTRPGADLVSVQEEIDRIAPVIEGLAGETSAAISIDTRKPEVAKVALAAGATVWNDVSALSFDDKSVELAAELGCDVVLMHAKGDPKTMQDAPAYVDVFMEVFAYLAARIELCVTVGVAREKIIIDPGIGFGKSLEHNSTLLRRLGEFQKLGAPVLLGASRKRFIGALDGDGAARGAEDRLGGSVAAAIEGWRRGASILRVHDVAATRQALRVVNAIEKPSFSV